MAKVKYQGKIKKVFVKALEAPDKFDNTHRYSIQMDDDKWYSVGTGKFPSLTMQDDDEKWKTLGEGSEVLIKYEQNGEYRNTKKADITILSFVEGKVWEPKAAGQTPAPKASGGAAPVQGFAKDDSGIETGHALNGAFIWLEDSLAKATAVQIDEVAKQVHTATRQLKAWYAENFPNVNAYNTGAASGNAIHLALRVTKARGKGLETVFATAKAIVGNIAQPLQDWIKAGGDTVAEEADAFDAPAAEASVPTPKPTPKPAAKSTPKPKPTPVPVVDEPNDDPAQFGSDIPDDDDPF